MADFPMISPLSDTELDAVMGGTYTKTYNIRQNARGGDSIAVGGNGGDATGGLASTGGVGGAATSAAGGAGGTNTLTL